MMECSHLLDGVQFDVTAPTAMPSGHYDGKQPSKWRCQDCDSCSNPWLCLTCGEIRCGRYVNGDGLKHFHTDNKHSVCLDCTSYAVYCYICDDFVINDTDGDRIHSIRLHLQKLESYHSTDEGSLATFQSSSHDSDGENRDLTSDRSTNQRSGLGTDRSTKQRLGQYQNQENKEEGRSLRRRRSSESCDSNKKLKTEDGAKAMVKPRTSGLRNLGNTCFMNAVLQSLSNIQHFCGYIKQLPSMEDRLPATKRKIQTRKTRDSEEDILLVEELRKTLIALWQGSKSAISPESLFTVIWKVVPRFRGYQQQDAHEFMRYLLDRLHSELLTLLPYPNNNSPFIGPKGKSTIVTAIFGGILQSEVKCLVCSVESKKHDPFLDLSLDIPHHFTAKSHKPKDGETLAHLSDCLQSFTDIEELEDSELYMCTNCKRRQPSTKKFWIRRLPNVLCLHLKRFRWNVYFRMKVESYVDFPLRGLEMSGFTLNDLHETRGCGSAGSNIYDLAAVIVHHGSGAGSGHYTAYAIHDSVWYHFNDSSVTVCDEETVKKCKAYILFYIRRQVKLPDHLKL